MFIRITLLSLFLIFGNFSSPVLAQQGEVTRFKNVSPTSEAHILTGTNENGLQQTFALAGVMPIDSDHPATSLSLQSFIGQGGLSCSKMAGHSYRNIKPMQCLNKGEQDIALLMIRDGFFKVYNPTLHNDQLFLIYRNIQRSSSEKNKGLWQHVNNFTSGKDETGLGSPKGLTLHILMVGVIVSALSMGVVGLMIYRGFRNLIKLQTRQIAVTNQKDKSIRERERFVLVKSLEGEIKTNRAKIEAFLTIYDDLLKNLRDASTEPKYKKLGEIIHKAPSLNRSVFEANLEKLDLLEIGLVEDLTNLYLNIDQEPEYKTFDAESDVSEVITFVENILLNAKELLNPMDQVASSLSVILRDKKIKIS